MLTYKQTLADVCIKQINLDCHCIENNTPPQGKHVNLLQETFLVDKHTLRRINVVLGQTV